jgi:dethiobiotin synthase
MPGVFVTGTDTNVGKTVTSALLCSALQQAGAAAGYFKPVQSGIDDDVKTVRALSGLAVDCLQNPVFAFPDPISPNRAAEKQGQEIWLAEIAAVWKGLPRRHWVVEGAGGLLVPLGADTTVRDLVKQLELPLLVVAPTRLGTINHTLLTIEAARHEGIPILGIILTGESDPGLARVLENYSGVQVVAEIPKIERLEPMTIASLARVHLPKDVLARVFSEEVS